MIRAVKPCVRGYHPGCPMSPCPGESNSEACRIAALRMSMLIPPAGDPDPHPRPAPTLLDMAASFGKAVVKQAIAGNPKASDEVQAERRRICFECPLLAKDRDQCSKCGCSMMELKRSWSTSRCPDDPPRWVEEPSHQ